MNRRSGRWRCSCVHGWMGHRSWGRRRLRHSWPVTGVNGGGRGRSSNDGVIRVSRRRHGLNCWGRHFHLRRRCDLRADRSNLFDLRDRKRAATVRLNSCLPLRKGRRGRGWRGFGNNRASLNRGGWFHVCRYTASSDRLTLWNGRRSQGVNGRRGNLAIVHMNDIARNRLTGGKGLLGGGRHRAGHALIDVSHVCNIHRLIDDYVCVVIVDDSSVHGGV